MADVVKRSGIKGGIVVHLGCGDGSETADMLLGSSYLVHGLDTRSDKVVTDLTRLDLRHKAFGPDPAETSGQRHIIPAGGFLDGQPQHRTCWTLASSISNAIWGDIMVSNGKEYYEVRGFPIYANHSCFDPRKHRYTLFAGSLASSKGSPGDAVANRRLYISLADGTVQCLGP